MKKRYTELEVGQPYPTDISERVCSGEIFVVRGCLQQLGLMDEFRETSISGIRRVAGDEVADSIQHEGLEFIHRHCDIEQIAKITDELSHLAQPKSRSWVSTIAKDLLNLSKRFYFERSPNIRFITPYDHMAKGLKALEEFARRHGGGKLTPHPPHRDSWVDCPDNVINIWIAVGPIPSGNGLTIFPDVYGNKCDRVASGSIAYHENPGVPVNFDLGPGDALLFDGEHLHATVLNHIEATRHVISFRVTKGKPNYPNGHYHHYLHSSLAGGPLKVFAEIPANLSWGWFRTRLRWVAEKLRIVEPPTTPKGWKTRAIPGDGNRTFQLSTLPTNSLKPIDNKICVARIGEDKVIAFDRRCPHDGADFAVGTVRDGNIVCPWHNLPFNSATGESPCKSLHRLRFYETSIKNDTVTISH